MCDQIKVSISSTNFQNIPFQLYEKDFTFYVNNIPYQTNRILADILSPIVQKMHYSDTTLNKLYITVKCPDYFEEFLKLAQKQNDEVDLNIAIIFSEYFEALGNIEEAIKIRSDYSTEINVDNVIERIENINKLTKNEQYETYNDEFSMKQLISYVASHFYEIDKTKCEKLPIETIEEILNDSSFKINDEDSLLDFILHLYEIDDSYSNLFEYVLFSNVSDEFFQLFISEFDIQFINQSIWKSMCSKILPNDRYSSEMNKDRYITEEGKEDKNEPTTLISMILSQFKSSSPSSAWNSTKIIIILYMIVDYMSYLYKYQIPYRHLIPHIISFNEDLEPNFDSLLADEDEELMNEYATYFPNFMPPEYLLNADQYKINEKSEVYTFSIIVFMCFTGRYPFQEKKRKSITDLVKRGIRENIPDEIPKNIKKLISDCWDNNPEDRPSFDEILQELSDTSNYDEKIDINLFKMFLNKYIDYDSLNQA